MFRLLPLSRHRHPPYSTKLYSVINLFHFYCSDTLSPTYLSKLSAMLELKVRRMEIVKSKKKVSTVQFPCLISLALSFLYPLQKFGDKVFVFTAYCTIWLCMIVHFCCKLLMAQFCSLLVLCISWWQVNLHSFLYVF